MAPTSDRNGDRVVDDELLAAASALVGLVQAALARGGEVAAADPPTLAEIERRHILHVLDQVRGNRKRCAAILGIDRKTLHRKLARYRNSDYQ
jgi:DNA-binding NtrC family response regulator